MHGKGVEPLRLAAAEPKAYPAGTPGDFRDDLGGHEDDGGPSTTLPTQIPDTSEGVLERAIAAVTRALAATDDPKLAGELVAERRALREELGALRRAGVVVSLDARRRR